MHLSLTRDHEGSVQIGLYKTNKFLLPNIYMTVTMVASPQSLFLAFVIVAATEIHHL